MNREIYSESEIDRRRIWVGSFPELYEEMLNDIVKPNQRQLIPIILSQEHMEQKEIKLEKN